ncbi:ABC transporter permease [Virgibacillus sp. NKC19-3]|uniref:ABC transporter permease n=1 Tax=Virgibacillus saliphilus TaxID=2831674 RepID=UPI001C9A4F42|nr:ABC transporter permease [Virgibacillus sp. NKC19-3]MBY7142532.1 ABC transporter permease [Virgibacillus sp. NKC19-3]
MVTFNDFKYVFQMQFNKSFGYLPYYMILQMIISLGIVIGFTYLIGNSNTESLLYLATGAPTIVLILTGVVLLPQQIATSKTEGYHQFLRTWPVNRGIILVADTLIWLIVAIPGIVISILVAHFMFHPGYDVTWNLVPALLLTAFTSIGIGYGFSYLLPPQLSMVLSNVLAFGSLMFAPINFPMERLPAWLQNVHDFLPLYSMAEVMRDALATSTFAASTGNYVNLAVWGIVGFCGTIVLINKK